MAGSTGTLASMLLAALLGVAMAAKPRTWEEAKAKASAVMATLNPKDRRAFLHGVKIGEEHRKPWEPEPIILAHRGYTRRIKDQGVPSLKMQDGASGFHNPPDAVGTSTCFPSMLALASTWDASLAESVGTAIGQEFKGKGANVLLGPGLNVHHFPTDGHNVDSLAGEDPYLGAGLARAYVGGVQSRGVAAALKSFGFPELGEGLAARNAIVDQQTAWELYYPPFEAAVEAGAVAVMCTGNMVNGTPACASERLLQRDLKKRMNFQGFVLSDWGATLPALPLGGVKLVQQGMDLEMPTEALLSKEALFFADKSRNSPVQEAFDTSLGRILAATFRLRLDDDEGCAGPHACSAALHSDQTSKEHSTLARSAAADAITLLSNDGVLPLKVGRLAVVGAAANASSDEGAGAEFSADYYSAGGPGHCRVRSLVTPLSAIAARAAQLGVALVASASNDVPAALEAARSADVVVVVAAATSTYNKLRSSLALDDGADELVANMSLVKPTVVLMQTPGAVLTPWRDNVSAVANLFLAGQETGGAWASFLFGDADPAGRLPVMFPASEHDTLRRDDLESGTVPYKEGRFTSYRSADFKAAFPFGHGLSFTSFNYSQPELLRSCKAKFCARLRVTNAGKRPGREVAQAYLEFPGYAKMPRKVLRGFQKTKLLKPGASEELLFEFTQRDLSSFRAGNWTVWEGVKAHFGASSEDLRHELLLVALPEEAPTPAPVPVLKQPVLKQKKKQAPVARVLVGKAPAAKQAAAPAQKPAVRGKLKKANLRAHA